MMDNKQKTKRETALNSLKKVLENCRKGFSNFRAAEEKSYQKSINDIMSIILPVWIQYREMYVQIGG